jgi:hypothetical protein
MEILINIKNLFISPRFITFYWNVGLTALVGLISLVSQNLDGLGLPVWAIVVIGAGLAQATKAISNFLQNKPLGFAPKK